MNPSDLLDLSESRNSPECPECDGAGMTHRYMRARTRDGRPTVGRYAVLCHLCPAGRTIARAFAENGDRWGMHPVDLLDHPSLWPESYRDAPDPAWFTEMDRLAEAERSGWAEERVWWAGPGYPWNDSEIAP